MKSKPKKEKIKKEEVEPGEFKENIKYEVRQRAQETEQEIKQEAKQDVKHEGEVVIKSDPIIYMENTLSRYFKEEPDFS